MELALVDGIRARASRGLVAVCPQCAAKMIPKCGTFVVHHWAHEANNECDPWWEPETEWHRWWKNWMPDECIEVTRKGHRADIVRHDGTVVELQHSPIAVESIAAREAAYGRMVWLFDGTDIPDDALRLRSREEYTSFRWKHPRKTYGACQRPVFIDLGDGDLFWLRRLHLDAPPYGGWGYIVEATRFVDWLTGDGRYRLCDLASTMPVIR